MAEYDIIIITVATTLIIISLCILFFLIKRGRQKPSINNEYEIIKTIIREFDNREDNQNKKIAELMLKIDILESKVSQKQTGPYFTYKVPNEGHIVKVEPEIVERVSGVIPVDIGPIELQILKYIATGSKTSREVQDTIKRSREHTARLLKVLYQKNYLSRENKGKYFLYSITENGRQFITR